MPPFSRCFPFLTDNSFGVLIICCQYFVDVIGKKIELDNKINRICSLAGKSALLFFAVFFMIFCFSANASFWANPFISLLIFRGFLLNLVLVWLNDLVFVYKISGCGFKSCCRYLLVLKNVTIKFNRSYWFSNMWTCGGRSGR